MILDAKDAFSKQRLFQAAWAELYPGLLEWVPLSKGGAVTSVDAATRTLMTDFGRHQAKVANVIPPQKAGRIADVAGVADGTGWCPIDPVTFRVEAAARASTSSAMPPSPGRCRSRHLPPTRRPRRASAAVARLLMGATPSGPKLINTCYSLVAPDYGISVAGVYQPSASGQLAEVAGFRRRQPRRRAARDARGRGSPGRGLFRTITDETFG